MIGPPTAVLYCWFLIGTTRGGSRLGSGELKLLSRKLDRKTPDRLLVPDLVIAFTCTPDDLPWVASNRFETNWHSAIESWLYRGWFPAPSSDEICCPSRLSWNSRASPPFRSGSGAEALVEDVRLSGARSARPIQLRPATGNSLTCVGSTLPPRLDDEMSMSDATAVT